jgi:hypothetical protein
MEAYEATNDEACEQAEYPDCDGSSDSYLYAGLN